MRKLGWPTLFCNTLVLDSDQAVVDYRLRIREGKKKAVEAFTAIGYDVVASGDSYNDISMLEAAKCGVLFRPPDTIKDEYPQFPVAHSHDELMEAITNAIATLPQE